MKNKFLVAIAAICILVCTTSVSAKKWWDPRYWFTPDPMDMAHDGIEEFKHFDDMFIIPTVTLPCWNLPQQGEQGQNPNFSYQQCNGEAVNGFRLCGQYRLGMPNLESQGECWAYTYKN